MKPARIKTLLIALLAFLISACTDTSSRVPPSPDDQATLAPSPTHTKTPIPSSTQLPSVTPIPPTISIIPSPTSSPTLGIPVTRTPAPAAECPKPGNPDPIPNEMVYTEFEQNILNYLNTGGSASGLQWTLNNSLITINEPVQFTTTISSTDITGDATPDLVMDLYYEGPEFVGDSLYIFQCKEGQYQAFALFPFGWFNPLGHETSDGLRAIRDMTLNGIPEIVYSFIDNVGAHGYFTRTFHIVEWDGAEFADLIVNPDFYDPGSSSNFAYAYNGDGVIRDTDDNGTLELLLTIGTAPHYVDEGPQRNRTEVLSWNGVAFTAARSYYDPPEYRFQAARDGDEASIRGDYDEALAFYQQAIFDEKLFGWTGGRFADPFYYGGETPTPDLEERPRLDAYSRYRIVLLHLLQGNMDPAQIVYDTLQEKFPANTVGHDYAQMAVAFWEDYLIHEDLTAACSMAIEFATTYWEIIVAPLGTGYYGLSYPYHAEDVCPI